MDRADVWVIERGGSFCFPLKTGESLRVLGYIIRKEFECDKAIELYVLSFVNDAHPSAAQFLDDAVMGNDLVDHGATPSYAGPQCKSMRQMGWEGGYCWRKPLIHHNARQLSSLSTSTIAAPCAGRTVSAVAAIRAYLRGEHPDGKRLRQFQRSFEAVACRPPHEPGAQRRGLRTRSLYYRPGGGRRLWCTHARRCQWQRRGRMHLSHAFPPAVFPHPRCSPCSIPIRHKIA